MEKFGIKLTEEERKILLQKYGSSQKKNKIKFRPFIQLFDPTQPNNIMKINVSDTNEQFKANEGKLFLK